MTTFRSSNWPPQTRASEYRLRPGLSDGIRSQTAKRHACTVRTAVCVPPLVAEIVTLVELVTDFVVTVKVALVFPEDTVTLAGTVATAVELLVRVTTIPAVGAGPESVTVPVEGEDPMTIVGLKVRELTTGAVTVRVAVFVAP